MSTSLYRTIVVGSDGSPTAANAVEFAATMSGGVASLEIVGAAGSSKDADKLKGKLEAAASELSERGFTVRARVDQGDPADVIIAAAEELGADLVVVGNKGMSGVKRFLLTPVPDKVSHRAHCSVLIANTTD